MGKFTTLKKKFILAAACAGIGLAALVAAEIGYRMKVDGSAARVQELVAAPHPDLAGAKKWMIADDALGYRLDPAQGGVNERSIRHKPITFNKTDGVMRIVVLGDSATWDRPSFVDVLRRTLKRTRKVELINATTPGYTARQQVLFFEERFEEIDFDLLIWTYSMDDNHRSLYRLHSDGRMLMTEEGARSLFAHSSLDALLNRSYLLTRLRLGHLGRLKVAPPASGYLWEARADANSAWKDHSWSEYTDQLRRLHDMVKKGGARLAMVILPMEQQVLLRADKDLAYVLLPQSKVSALCIENRIPCMDPFAEFATAYDQKKKLYRDALHLNRAGHLLVGKELARFLVKQQLLP